MEGRNRTIVGLKSFPSSSGIKGGVWSQSHHSGIEIRARARKGSRSQSRNRTIVGLKCDSFILDKSLGYGRNRTIVGLKFRDVLPSVSQSTRRNRTIVGLKCAFNPSLGIS